MKLFVVGALLALGSLPSFAQNIAISAWWNWDSGSGTAYLHSEASTDYSSAYYYDMCLYNYINEYYSIDSIYDAEYNSESTCGSGSSIELDTDVPVGAGAYDVQYDATFNGSITYNTYQFSSYCFFDCYDYYFWDAYRMGLLSSGGYTGPVAWNLAGAPGQSVPQSVALQVSIQGLQSACPTPASETTTYTGIKPLASTPFAGQYGAKFRAQLNPTSTIFRARVVTEVLSGFVDGCHWPQSLLMPKQLTDITWGTVPWTVGNNNIWETDYITTGEGWADYYLDQAYATNPHTMGGASCTIWSASQQMRIQACSSASTTAYETHGMATVVSSGQHLTVTRDGAQGAAK